MRPLSTGPGQAIIVVGLGFGDEAKGATVDHLAWRIPDTTAVVRWSGGVQAAHNVVHGPRHHTFRQFGSATLLGVPTLLRAPMMVDPLGLTVEAEELRGLGVAAPLNLITADPRCLVTTPFHAAMNRAREESRGTGVHGSCGMGVGETVAFALAAAGLDAGNLPLADVGPGAPVLRVGDLRDRAATIRGLDAVARAAATLTEDLPAVGAVAEAMCDLAGDLRIADDMDAVLARRLEAGTVIFEGSQGVLLDEFAGFHPHTTWATLNPRARANASGGAADSRDVTGLPSPHLGLADQLERAGHRPYVLGLTRSYSTRHGAGPLPTEDPAQRFPEPHNGVTYQGAWRQGPLDLDLLRYAARAVGVDGVGVSHLDAPVRVVSPSWSGPESRLRDVRSLSGQDLEIVRDANAAAATRAHPEYDRLQGRDDVISRIEEATGAPVVLVADGPTRTDRSIRWSPRASSASSPSTSWPAATTATHAR